MPELPEVETVKRILEPQIKGYSITKFTVNRPDVIANPSVEEFCNAIIGAEVSGIGRRGKFLIIDFNNDNQIIIHLRMTGQLFVAPTSYPQEKHTHIVFHFNNKVELHFIDVRRFGRLWLKRANDEDTFSGIKKLGLEPFDAGFNLDYLKRKLGRRHKTIKECLLDQNSIAGIGNIYADEILFAARIIPTQMANSLTDNEWQALAKEIPTVLKFGIENNKITAEEYFIGKGSEYRNTPFLKVYGREGKPCNACGATIVRIIISGRSSCYCPQCQKNKSENRKIGDI